MDGDSSRHEHRIDPIKGTDETPETLSCCGRVLAMFAVLGLRMSVLGNKEGGQRLLAKTDARIKKEEACSMNVAHRIRASRPPRGITRRG